MVIFPISLLFAVGVKATEIKLVFRMQHFCYKKEKKEGEGGCQSYTWDYALLSLCRQHWNWEARIVLVVWEQCMVVYIPLWTAAFAQANVWLNRFADVFKLDHQFSSKVVDSSNYRLNFSLFFLTVHDVAGLALLISLLRDDKRECFVLLAYFPS